ncbi:MAG: sterol desaturase family protein [Pseudomonadota bacterium]
MSAYFSEFLPTYIQMTLFIWARYFVIAGVFYAGLWLRPAEKVAAGRLAKKAPERAIVLHEVKMSVISSAIYAVPGAIVFMAWRSGGTAIYSDIVGVSGWLYVAASVVFYLFLHDTYFYWTHRAMHHPKLFRATHLTHHRSKQPTPWAAFSFHPWEAAISAWLLPLATFFVPIHEGAVLFLLVLMTYCSVANHSGWEILPRAITEGPFGRFFVTARHHNVHHTDYKANYALYFRFWDYVCGTDRGLAPVLDGPLIAPKKRAVSA